MEPFSVLEMRPDAIAALTDVQPYERACVGCQKGALDLASSSSARHAIAVPSRYGLRKIRNAQAIA